MEALRVSAKAPWAGTREQPGQKKKPARFYFLLSSSCYFLLSLPAPCQSACFPPLQATIYPRDVHHDFHNGPPHLGIGAISMFCMLTGLAALIALAFGFRHFQAHNVHACVTGRNRAWPVDRYVPCTCIRSICARPFSWPGAGIEMDTDAKTQVFFPYRMPARLHICLTP